MHKGVNNIKGGGNLCGVQGMQLQRDKDTRE